MGKNSTSCPKVKTSHHVLCISRKFEILNQQVEVFLAMAARICNQLLVRSGRFRKIYRILDCTWSNSLSSAKDRSFASIALQEYQAEFLSFQRICFFQCRRQKTLSSSSLSHAPSTKQMEQFLASQELAFEHGHTSILATCPFCSPRGGKDKPQEDLSLYINKTTGSHVCKQCKSAGSWNQFKVK